MSASTLLDMASSQQDSASSRQARLGASRDAGQRLDPTRFYYLEVLSQRIATAPNAVRRVLEIKLDAALTELEDRLRQGQTAARDAVARLCAAQPDQARELQRLLTAGDFVSVRRLGAQGTLKRPVAPLFELNQYLQQAKHCATDHLEQSSLTHSLASDGEAHAEMVSVHRFREAWSRIAAEDQVTKAAGRGPDNAGPLNSHRLVLQSLTLLRELSPDYLRRFLSHVQTLQWLEQASQTITPVKAKPARHSRVKK